MLISYTSLDFPLGKLYLAAIPEGIVRIIISPDKSRETGHILADVTKQFPKADFVESANMVVCAQAVEELQQYFACARTEFTCQICPQGTPFQQKVWEMVKTIPYGETRTYGKIAEQLGDKRLSRAVGLANGANPIPIIIPCHRVIGKGDLLTGYGGGLAMKQYLLQLEGAILR